MTMTERFLKAKHWQLFALMFGIPMVFQFVAMGAMIASVADGTPPTPAEMLSFFKFFPVLMIVLSATFFGWFWSIAIGLQDKVPAHVKMKTRKFKIFFFVPIIYLPLFSLGMVTVMSAVVGMAETGGQPNIGLMGSIMAIIFPLHFFTMFCMFYTLYFVAKTFKTVELQRETAFSDFVGEFFMLWFYPIGIWIIQPKVNKMVEGGEAL
jgi:hypothetical protein